MKKIGAIHTFEDRAFLNGITRASIAVLVAGVVVAAGWYVAVGILGRATGVTVPPFELTTVLGGLGARLTGADSASAHFNPLWWVSIALVTVVSFVVHELVHGFFFRQFAPPGARVTFGANLKMGMLYASAEGIVYTRQQYLVIAVAPSIAVTLLLVAVGIGLKWPLWTIVVATAHLSGCTGDWGYMRAILRDPSITHCEDTSWGVEFYGDECVESDEARELDEGVCLDGSVTPSVCLTSNACAQPDETAELDDCSERGGDAGDAADADVSAVSARKPAADKGFSVVDGGKSA